MYNNRYERCCQAEGLHQLEGAPVESRRHASLRRVQGWLRLGAGEDARSRLVEATAAGRAKRLEAQRAWKQAQLALNARLGCEQVAALHTLIDDCIEQLADQQGDAAADDPLV